MNAELKHRLSETASASSSSPTFATKVSRKEESKVNVPPWPKVNDLGLWKANLIQAIVVAANDSDQQPWIGWVKAAIDGFSGNSNCRSPYRSALFQKSQELGSLETFSR